MRRDDLLVWMDLEMTSLVDVRVDTITEIAVIITDNNLNIVAEGPDIVIHADPARFDQIPADVRAIHDKSGIIPLVAASTVSQTEAEQQVLAFVSEYVAPVTSPLCGSSVHMDRMFLYTHMPALYAYLFHRNIDVSTMKEMIRRWRPMVYDEWGAIKGEHTHRALDDIKRSIRELQFYKSKLFV
ncbi:MAG: oligoribonuclease [Patescibacteria group bacterium]